MFLSPADYSCVVLCCVLSCCVVVYFFYYAVSYRLSYLYCVICIHLISMFCFSTSFCLLCLVKSCSRFVGQRKLIRLDNNKHLSGMIYVFLFPIILFSAFVLCLLL